MSTFHGQGFAVPRRTAGPFARTSPSKQVTAVLDALLGIRPLRTSLDFEEFACVDGLLYARTARESDFRHYLGPRADLLDAIERHAIALALGPQQRARLFTAIADIPEFDVADDDETTLAS